MPEQQEPQSTVSKNALPIIPQEYRDTSLVELGPILEAEAKYGPIFRRALFDAAYTAWESLKALDQKDHDAEKDKNEYHDVSVRDIYGIERRIRTGRDGLRTQRGDCIYMFRRVWIYNSIQRLGHLYGRDNSRHLCSYSFGSRDEEVDRQSCFSEEALLERTKAWTEEWNNSDICRRLTSFLAEHVGRSMNHVDKIICFGLGCFPAAWEYSMKRSYFQHLAACTVRDILTIHQGDNVAPKILAQEPVYCAAGTSYLTTPKAYPPSRTQKASKRSTAIRLCSRLRAMYLPARLSLG